MNLAKAKDYFSAYYEGSLDRGLRQSFEARLKEDAQLQAEYKAFERTMMDLEALGHVEIEPPADLHERIAARLDRALWEQKQQKVPTFGLGWLRGLTMAGVIAAGVFVAVFSYNSRHTDNANIVGVPIPSAQSLRFSSQGRGVVLSYPSVQHKTVTIKNADGSVLQTFALDHQGINDKPLQNTSESAQLLAVEVTDNGTATSYLALPGTNKDQNTGGKGTVKDLALAVAGHYGVPVVVDATDSADKSVSWDLSSPNAVNSAYNAVSQLQLSVTEKEGSVIHIEKN